MASDRKPPPPNPGSPQRRPEWADGLKQLYDSVVEEELPESFKILLARLDQIDPRRADPGSGAAPQGPDDRGAQE
jgi:hypothetical protein